MNGDSIRLAVLTGIATALTPCLASAQDADQPAEAPAGGMQEVVVTATATSVRKLDASYTIVTADAEKIRRANPKSTADLLKISPGMWPESTGGQTGANIEIAGFPGGGDAPYFTTQLMGSPLYGMPTLSFFETTTHLPARRHDRARRRSCRAARPWCSPAARSAPPPTSCSRRGTRDADGQPRRHVRRRRICMRVDGFYGFPVGDELVRQRRRLLSQSDGVRDPQFKADEGGQLTAHAQARDFDSGQLMSVRALSRRQEPVHHADPVDPDAAPISSAPIPGFDPLNDTYNSKAIQHVCLRRLSRRRHERGSRQRPRRQNGVLRRATSTTSSATAGRSSTSSSYNARRRRHERAVLGQQPGDARPTSCTPLRPISAASGCRRARRRRRSSAAAPCGPDQSVIHQGWWFIHKELMNFNNDLRLSKKIFDGNTLTAGVYLAYYTMDDKWALGNQMLMTNEPNARPITVSYVDGWRDDDPAHGRAGLLDYGGFNITEKRPRVQQGALPVGLAGASTSGCSTRPCAGRTRTRPTACAI